MRCCRRWACSPTGSPGRWSNPVEPSLLEPVGFWQPALLVAKGDLLDQRRILLRLVGDQLAQADEHVLRALVLVLFEQRVAVELLRVDLLVARQLRRFH